MNRSSGPSILVLVAVGNFAVAQTAPKPVLVDVAVEAPSIVLDMRYATSNNFTGKALYPVARCLLRPEAAAALGLVQNDLKAQGLGLKVYDCYRPLSVQRKFWELVHDRRYVADPVKGSRHNRGLAVDLTLIDAKGRESKMPTAFDDFTPKARRNAPAAPEAAKNRAALEQAMKRRGFVGLATEWWHFDYPGWDKAPVLDIPLESRQ